ncbi:MAG: hypothetical protein IKF82_00195 [Bacilli bacterium]|nr:hypothetical protein [Bacilli bacterium]
MKSKNKLIYLVRSIIGNDEPSGFYTPVRYNDKIIKVPNYLFKDAPAEYPEVRISPFISDVEETVAQRFYGCHNKAGKLRFYTATFQIDIYATTIPLVNNIYEAIFKRVDLFNDYDTVIYGYNKSFQEIEEGLYFSPIYDSQSFNIFRIHIKDNIICPIDNIENINNNTYMINEDGLYVRTTLPIQKIKIHHIINGLKFNNNKTSYQEHILNMNISNVRMLSELENDDVERISFRLNIFYHMWHKRNFGPILEDVIISSDENDN